MVITTKSQVIVSGRTVRVLSSLFNAAVKLGKPIFNADGKAIVPGKGHDWASMCAELRAGRSVQAKLAGKEDKAVVRTLITPRRTRTIWQLHNIRRGASFRKLTSVPV